MSPHHPDARRPRVRAPELRGRGWLNTGGRDLRLADLRGRFLLLDFWTFCCVNCLHVLDELRPLEETYAGELVVVGVHSPKFVHEADPEALAAAVERYSVHHPVLDDPDLVTWQAYTARAWPTLVLVDPEGYVVAQYAGEGHAHAIDALLDPAVGRALGQGHAAAGGLALRTAAGGAERPAVPGEGRAAAGWAGAGRRRRPRPGGRAGRRRGGAASVRAGSGSPTGSVCCPPRWPSGSGTTWWSPTPCTTSCAGSALATGQVTVLAGDGHQWMRARHRAALLTLGRGVVARPGLGRDGRHPPAVDLRPDHRVTSRSLPVPRTRACWTVCRRRRGSPRPPGWPST